MTVERSFHINQNDCTGYLRGNQAIIANSILIVLLKQIRYYTANQ